MKRNMKRLPLDGWCRIALEVSLLAVFGAVSAVNAGERDDERDRPVPLTVPKAVCGPNDHPETALQGQVPATMRAAGFKGFSCNLELLGQSRGNGANWQTTQFKQRSRDGGDDDADEGDRDGDHGGDHGGDRT